MSYGIMDRWYRGEIEDLEAANKALGRLESLFRQLQDMVETGPVPGAYIPIQFRVDGEIDVETAADVVYIPPHFGLRPIVMSAFLAVGVCTFKIKQGSTSIQTANMTIDTGVSKTGYIANSGDFALNSISTRLNLEVMVSTGPAEDLRVFLLCKQAKQAEEL